MFKISLSVHIYQGLPSWRVNPFLKTNLKDLVIINKSLTDKVVY